MKKWIFLSLFLTCSCSQKNPSKNPVSFYKGYTFWKNMTENPQFPYDVNEVIEGIKAASSGKESIVKEEEIVAILDQFEQKQIAQNLADAEKMLQTLSSSCTEVVPNKLYYRLLQSGEKNQSITQNSLADFIYTVSILENGSFKEIFSTGQTSVRINIQDTIPGFALATIGMLRGEKRVLYMHPDLNIGNYPEFLCKLIMIEIERQ
jgi:FKBP-type peptidyl-prolyl cis-trans isomerase